MCLGFLGKTGQLASHIAKKLEAQHFLQNY